jgi:hypothetical protein
LNWAVEPRRERERERERIKFIWLRIGAVEGGGVLRKG